MSDKHISVDEVKDLTKGLDVNDPKTVQSFLDNVDTAFKGVNDPVERAEKLDLLGKEVEQLGFPKFLQNSGMADVNSSRYKQMTESRGMSAQRLEYMRDANKPASLQLLAGEMLEHKTITYTGNAGTIKAWTQSEGTRQRIENALVQWDNLAGGDNKTRAGIEGILAANDQHKLAIEKNKAQLSPEALKAKQEMLLTKEQEDALKLIKDNFSTLQGINDHVWGDDLVNRNELVTFAKQKGISQARLEALFPEGAKAGETPRDRNRAKLDAEEKEVAARDAKRDEEEREALRARIKEVMKAGGSPEQVAEATATQTAEAPATKPAEAAASSAPADKPAGKPAEKPVEVAQSAAPAEAAKKLDTPMSALLHGDFDAMKANVTKIFGQIKDGKMSPEGKADSDAFVGMAKQMGYNVDLSSFEKSGVMDISRDGDKRTIRISADGKTSVFDNTAKADMPKEDAKALLSSWRDGVVLKAEVAHLTSLSGKQAAKKSVTEEDSSHLRNLELGMREAYDHGYGGKKGFEAVQALCANINAQFPKKEFSINIDSAAPTEKHPKNVHIMANGVPVDGPWMLSKPGETATPAKPAETATPAKPAEVVPTTPPQGGTSGRAQGGDLWKPLAPLDSTKTKKPSSSYPVLP